MSWTNVDCVEVLAHSNQRGVFVRCDLDAGQIIGVFDGVADVFAMDADGHIDWRGQDGAWSIHLKISEGKLFAIMPIASEQIAGIDFINHSCRANCRCEAGGLVVQTLRPIPRGEQLTLNYHDMDLTKLGRPCWCDHVSDAERCVL